MVLFADAADDHQLVLLAQIIVAGLTAIAGGYYTFKANAAVTEVKELKGRVEQNEKQIKECESDRGALRIDNNKLRDYVGLLYRTMHEMVNELRGVQDRESGRHPDVPLPKVDLAMKVANLPPPPVSCTDPICPRINNTPTS